MSFYRSTCQHKIIARAYLNYLHLHTYSDTPLFVNAFLFIPQGAKLWKTKDGKSLSLMTFLGLCFIQVMLIAHGYLHSDWILFYGYILSLLLCGTLTFFIAYFQGYRNSLSYLVIILFFIVFVTVGVKFSIITAFLFSIALFINAALFIPQAVKIFKQKNADDISLITFLGFVFIQLSTIVYGFMIKDYLLVVGYVLSVITCGAVVFIAITYQLKKGSCFE